MTIDIPAGDVHRRHAPSSGHDGPKGSCEVGKGHALPRRHWINKYPRRRLAAPHVALVLALALGTLTLVIPPGSMYGGADVKTAGGAAAAGPPSDEAVRSLVASNGGIVAFTVTYYESTSDLRFKRCMDTIAESVRNGIPLVVVDGSPSEEVRSALSGSGAVFRRQTAKGRKGAALREAAGVAVSLPGVGDDSMLCWQEAEKVGMVGLWRTVREASGGGRPEAGGGGKSDVAVPWRDARCFRETYPREQVHSETFGNMYLDAVLTDTGLDLPRIMNAPPSDDCGGGVLKGVDWHFGPFAFRAKHVRLWTEYRGGDSYDAQVVPIVHAFRKGLTVSSVNVEYRAPVEMKEQEEGNVGFIEKRLWQLNDLDPRVKKAWTEDFYC